MMCVIVKNNNETFNSCSSFIQHKRPIMYYILQYCTVNMSNTTYYTVLLYTYVYLLHNINIVIPYTGTTTTITSALIYSI